MTTVNDPSEMAPRFQQAERDGFLTLANPAEDDDASANEYRVLCLGWRGWFVCVANYLRHAEVYVERSNPIGEALDKFRTCRNQWRQVSAAGDSFWVRKDRAAALASAIVAALRQAAGDGHSRP